MKIQVTEDHICRGQPGRGDCCPVALALRESGFPNVHVSKLFIWHDGPGRWSHLPAEVKKFVEDFDAGAVVVPFEFEVETSM